MKLVIFNSQQQNYFQCFVCCVWSSCTDGELFVGGSHKSDAAENNAENRCSRKRHQLFLHANIYKGKHYL